MKLIQVSPGRVCRAMVDGTTLQGAKYVMSTEQSCSNSDDSQSDLYFARTEPRRTGLASSLCVALKELGISRLTDLQGALIPHVLRGKHVVAQAETGTGKSFGVALAAANRIALDTIAYRLHTAVIVPTEELAYQYDRWLRYFCGSASQVAQVAVESIPLQAQLTRLHNVHPHILVATPQRFAEVNHMSKNVMGDKLRNKLDTIIIDEVDNVLFSPVTLPGGRRCVTADVLDSVYRSQIDDIPAQIVAISATLDSEASRSLNRWMRNDRSVRLTTSNADLAMPETLRMFFFCKRPSEAEGEHTFKRVIAEAFSSGTSKLSYDVVASGESDGVGDEDANTKRAKAPTVLVFTATERIGAVVQLLRDWGYDAEPLHQADAIDLTVAQKSVTRGNDAGRFYSSLDIVGSDGQIFAKDGTTIQRLFEGSLRIAVGGFNGARGLHVRDVTHVIMLGCPTTHQFVHCAGRTGRMGEAGKVVMIFAPHEGKAALRLLQGISVPMRLSSVADDPQPLPSSRPKPKRTSSGRNRRATTSTATKELHKTKKKRKPT